MNLFGRLLKVTVIFFALSLFIQLPNVIGQVSTPESYLGFKPGADYHLMTYEQAMGYLEQLADESNRIKIFDMGLTSMGKRMKYAIISSEKNMTDIDRCREITKKLSLVRGITEEEAGKLADEGKAVVWIDGGLHASECAPAQHLPQLAYDLVTGEDPMTRSIRDNVIALLVFPNPDGMDIIAEWYNRNLGNPYEVSRLPWLYHKYVGHDNNRDSYMANQFETQNMSRIQNHVWFPEVLLNHHQTAPFPARIWFLPNAEPTNPNVHPIVVRWQNLMGTAMGKMFEENNQEGAISRIFFDSWYPGYVTQIVDSHNIPSILTEIALYRYATPHFYTINDFPKEYQDRIMAVFYPSPWKGGWWRLGDAVAYALTASKSVLDVAAKYRRELLYDKYKMGKDVIEKFKNEPPYGWIVPAEQHDPNAAALMLNRLILLGTEVYKADDVFTHDGIKYSEGSYIIPTSQPFGFFAKNMFESQQYPDLRKYPDLWQGLVSRIKWEGAPLRPYDAAGWTLPIQIGVEKRSMSKPLDVAKTIITESKAPEGRVSGSGSVYYITHNDINSFKAINRIMAAGGRVKWALEEFSSGGKKYPAGTFLVESRSINTNRLKEIASDVRVSMTGGSASVKSAALPKLRAGLYKSWTASMDEGWIRWLFEQYEFPFSSLFDAEVKAGDLKNRFDVIILPDIRTERIINGHRPGTIPPDYVGGITEDGLNNLKKFVNNGGILVCINNSCDLALDYFKIPVSNILKGVKPEDFFCSGSLLKTDYDIKHPVAFGMKKRGMAFFSFSRVFRILPSFSGKNKKDSEKPKIIAKYPDESLLLSGWIFNDKKIRQNAAAVDVPLGKGRVILFGFNIHNRAQAISTIKLLFNSMYYR